MSTLAEALAPKSDQLNADDLIAGPRVIKITGARIVKDDRQVKIVVNFEGDQGKPWKPCKTMGRAMVMVWSITDETQLVGKSLRLYRDPDVKFGDQGAIGGIRVSHMSHIDTVKRVKLTVSQGKKSEFVFHPLVTDVPRQPADDFTIEAAELALRTAATADDLRAEWVKARMRPYREQLQSVLDERKAALAGDDEDLDDAAKLVRQYDNATSSAMLATADKGANVLGLADEPAVIAARDAAKGRGL